MFSKTATKQTLKLGVSPLLIMEVLGTISLLGTKLNNIYNYNSLLLVYHEITLFIYYIRLMILFHYHIESNVSCFRRFYWLKSILSCFRIDLNSKYIHIECIKILKLIIGKCGEISERK